MYCIILSIIFGSFFTWAEPVKIGVFSKDHKLFNEFVKSLQEHNGSKNEYVLHRLEKPEDFDEFKSVIEKNKYKYTVLVDNVNLGLQQRYNLNYPAVKSISVFALNIEEELKDRNNIAAIRLEPPLFSLVNSFNFLFNRPNKKILAIYRKSVFEKSVQRAKSRLKFNNLEILEYDVEKNGLDEEAIDQVLAKLHTSIKLNDVGAIWIPLDSVIMSKGRFSKYWIPFAKKIGVPILMQAENLAHPKLNFATFAASPNIGDLADQVNQMMSSIVGNQLKVHEIGVEEVISIQKYLNTIRQDEFNLKIRQDYETEVIKLR